MWTSTAAVITHPPKAGREMARRVGRGTVVLLIAAALLGCKKDKDKKGTDADDDAALVADSANVTIAESDVQLVTSSLVSAAPGTVTLANLSGDATSFQTIGDGAKSIYFPRTCLTVDPPTA